MTTPEDPQFGRDAERETLISTARRLNERMSSGVSIYEPDSLELVRSLPRPICLDFNRTLVSSYRPYTVNPQAKGAISELRKIGTVFVVTSASNDWDFRKSELERFGLWHEGMVLMTKENYEIDNRQKFSSAANSVEQYVKMRDAQGQSFSENQFLDLNINNKRLAPVFMKPYDVPIIDDDGIIVFQNPGMLGIWARDFTVDSEWQHEESLGLLKAVEVVRKHYQEVDDGKI